jgi:catechol 2,3-dioxygenase-like lactoylglutathione lyase family enzyme
MSVLVEDQDRARRFYTELLGLQVKTDLPYSETEQWLTVVSSEDPGGIELVLHKADGAALAFQRACREAGRPAFAFSTKDIQADYERLSAAGVAFRFPPTRMDYGGTDAVFEDGCGNLVDLHQD